MKKLLLFISTILFCQAIIAQQNNTLLLRNGNFVPSNNASEFSENFRPSRDLIFSGRYYLLVQFSSIPTQEVKSQMETEGMKFLEYIPHNAYIVSVPAGFALNRLNIFGARSMMLPGNNLKMSEEVYKNELPEWATSGNEALLVVKYYDDLNRNEVKSALERVCLVNDEYPRKGSFTISIGKEKISELAAMPFVQYIEAIPSAPVHDDIEGRSLHRSNVINSEYGAGRHYDGTGVTVGLADDGIIGPHIDYTGRLTQFSVTNNGNHGDMTSGIFFGAGNLTPNIQGHASGAYMYYFDIGGYNHVVDAVSNFSTYGIILTSTSYSQTTGGVYTTDAEFIDNQIHDNPQFLHIFSAGNAGTADHGYGAGAGWGNITGGYKAAKNVIACGNLRNYDLLESSSSRGPADDGRIKPDICANGYNQLSTDGPNTWQVGGGTSAAAPSVAGTVTQLYHAYKSLNGNQNPEGALIKAAILNTAEDLGNPGPDYKHGWGRINALRAVRVLEQNTYLVDSITQGNANTHSISVPSGTAHIRVMVYWADFQGSSVAAKALVNDIDMTVTDPGSTVWNPWVLDPTPNVTALNSNAVRGVDTLNNAEQVTLDNPSAGNYTVTVNGTAIPQGPQKYWLVWQIYEPYVEVTYPIGGEGLVPGTVEKVRWDAIGTTGTYNLDYSTDNGTSWVAIASNIGNTFRTYDWTVPSLVTDQALVRVTSGAYSDTSETNFTIIGQPANLTVDYVCPDSIGLSWSLVGGATAYEVSMLGNKYMDSMTTTTALSATIYGQNPNDVHWFSVRSIAANGGKGRRVTAIEQVGGTVNCILPVDVSMDMIVSPANGGIPDCQASAATPIQIQVTNNGLTPASNIPVYYQVNGGPIVNETMAGPVNNGNTATYTFTQTANLGTAGSYNIVAWADFASDANFYNDTTSNQLTVYAASVVNLPVTEDFESFTNCAITTNCEQTICTLMNGWVNATNLTEDDIDWRVDDNGTASSGTGPSVDHNPGTAAGNYVYLEASGGCEGKVALMMSPCIDLTSATSPKLEFWYHMYGVNMGELHVDVMSGGAWTLDAMAPISGNQLNIWRQGTVDLSAYTGQVINVRFRGITGPGFESDMALDDIRVIENQAAPIVDFNSSPLTSCPNMTVTLTDMSSNNPSSWLWSITPGTYSFVGGTSATSQNPQVTFSATGLYTIKLVATNGFGTDSLTKTDYIEITTGSLAPIAEDFQSGWIPTGWSVADAGQAYTWALSSNITGASGTTTNAAWVNNFNYNSPGSEDQLITMPIDLSGSVSASMTFDVAYVEYDATYTDQLRIDASTDCGATFTPTTYYKDGPALATAPQSTTNWSPTSAGEWRNDTLDLTSYLGGSVIISFVNINGYGNNLYIDNVNIDGLISVDQLEEGQVLNVYPNPNGGTFFLEIKGAPLKSFTMDIQDLSGKVVMRKEQKMLSEFYHQKIDVTSLSAGVYLMKVYTREKQMVKKIIIH